MATRKPRASIKPRAPIQVYRTPPFPRVSFETSLWPCHKAVHYAPSSLASMLQGWCSLHTPMHWPTQVSTSTPMLWPSQVCVSVSLLIISIFGLKSMLLLQVCVDPRISRYGQTLSYLPHVHANTTRSSQEQPCCPHNL
jgi:hypothetical protein